MAVAFSVLLVCSASPRQALATCSGPCSSEQASTGLASPPSWAAGRHIHFEAESVARSAYTPKVLGGEGEEGEGGPLLYHESGHGVQHTPKVYLIFWGSNFTTTEKGKEVHAMLLKLFEGLSNSAYQGILTQYFDSTGRVSSTATVTPYTDEALAAPKTVNEVKVEEEVTHAITTNSWKPEQTAQFFLVSAPGSTYEAGFNAGACAYHGVTIASEHVTAGVVYDFVPYQGDPPYSEGCVGVGNPSKNPVFKTSKSTSHEYAEAATDPEPGGSAYAWRAPGGAEIADICSSQNDFELPSGAYAQNQYDDHQNMCSHEDLTPPHAYAITEAATGLAATEATLHGTANAEGLESSAYFEYGPTKSYGTKTAEVGIGSGVSTKTTSQTISGLSGETTYHYRVVTVNSSGTTSGEDKTFSTVGKPFVETRPASAITTTGATLNGTVNPRGSETKYFFEYGPTEAYGSKTAETNAGSGTTALEESKAITELNPSTTYQYRMVATNGLGTTVGSNQSFTTMTPAWSVVSTPNPSGATVTGFGGPYIGGKTISCTSATACTAVGHYKNSSGIFVTLAERWNGSSWSIQTTPNPTGAKESYLDGVSCTSSTACTAVGFYKNSESVIVSLAEHWNGSEWSVQTTPNPAEGFEVRLRDVSCASASECIAVGRYSTKTGEFTLAERWNGTAWSIQTTSNKGVHRNWLYSVSCPSSSFCEAVGYYTKEVGGNALMAEAWNGSKWEVQEPPNPSGGTEPGLDSVSCSSSTACTAVGWYKNSSGTYVTLAERWNGSAWSIQSTPNPSGAINNFLGGVSCFSGSSCTTVGYDQNSAGTYVTLAESWNGSSWSIQSSPNPTGAKESALDGVACLSLAVCNSVGAYVNGSGTEVSLGETYK